MLFKLLSAPVVLPIKAILKVANQAQEEYYNPSTIIGEFENLKLRYESDEISMEDYLKEKKSLNERMKNSKLFNQENR